MDPQNEHEPADAVTLEDEAPSHGRLEARAQLKRDCLQAMKTQTEDESLVDALARVRVEPTATWTLTERKSEGDFVIQREGEPMVFVRQRSSTAQGDEWARAEARANELLWFLVDGTDAARSLFAERADLQRMVEAARIERDDARGEARDLAINLELAVAEVERITAQCVRLTERIGFYERGHYVADARERAAKTIADHVATAERDDMSPEFIGGLRAALAALRAGGDDVG